MKPSIQPPVLFDETIGRGSSLTSSSLLLHISFAKLSFAEADSCCCCMYISPLLFILSIHLEQAMAETANTKRLHKAFLNPEAVLRMVFIWLTGTIFTDEAVAPFLHATRLKSQRLWSLGPARSDVRKRAGCARVSWCQIWRKRSPKQTQRAGLACLAALEICVKR